ncbi:hypothetical protein SAMN05446927_5394 [Caballeronia arationis]|uniref:Uncharacterized protein n=1 Tax=Caballeronia arationis TaxID=1777142 RepID=A0A7Z7IBE6_9BURK|nr:hypothetical protein [Caballeronia arationis]SOE82085.1 hypothetical protein SAMN05446927_5394 [Caballeronia arationis]
MKRFFIGALVALFSVATLGATTVPSSLINWVAPLPIADGGTGATSAAAARAALGVPSIAGDIFTGNIQMNYSNPRLQLNDTSASGSVDVSYYKNSVLTWRLQKTSADNFVVARAVSGTFVDNPISIANATGVVTYTAIPVQPTPSTADNSTNSATTAYVVGLAESREAKRSVRIGADKQLRNSQFQYEMGLSSGSEKRR